MGRGPVWVLVAFGACTAGVSPAPEEAAGGGDAVPALAAERGPCRPEAGGPYAVEEGEALAITARCAGELALGGHELRVSGLPRGAAYDPARAEITWTPALDQAGVYHLTLSAPATGEAGTVKITVADRFDAPGNAPLAAPLAYTEETGLPVLHLNVDPAIDSETYTPAVIAYRGRAWRAEAKYRGNSSLGYPKKHFTLKFPAADPFVDPLGEGESGRRRKMVLTANFDDNTHVRQRMAYELWNRLAPGGVHVRHASVVLYLDGAYHGLYTLTDHVDAPLMAAHGLDPEGNLYKAIGPEANFFPKHPIWAVYEKKAGTPAEGELDAFADLEELTEFVHRADAERFRAEIGARVELREYRAWLILVTALSARDTLGKNTYHYHLPGRSRWRVVPWDFNHSFGQDWATFREPPDLEPQALARLNRLLGRLHDDPVLGPETRAGYAAALRGALSRDAVLTLLARLVAEVSPAARRDERRWRARYLAFDRWSRREDFTDFEAEVAYVRRWIDERWTLLAQRYPAP